MIKAVLFDMDGTLIDFLKLKKIACEQAASAMVSAGLDMKPKEASEKLFDTYMHIGIESENAFQEFIKQRVGELDDRILAAGLNAYLKTKEVFLEPLPGVPRTLMQLVKRGYLLAIITDAPRLKAWQRLMSMKIDVFFDTVVTFHDSGEMKPNKAPFEKALKELKLGPNEVIMIGDNPSRDIDGANSLGIKTVFAKYCCFFEEKGKTKPDYIIDDVTELLEILP